jgi:hypothetical protein
LIVAAVLVSEVRRNSPWLVTIGAPVVALLRIGMRRITAAADAKPLRLQEGNQRADKRAADHIAR